ncbi:hypothetical protein A6A27_37535 [Micromonospora sp. CB01531]|nr:hypothetical protein A6A27_37535 [Micromonospora sp. CB01531]
MPATVIDTGPDEPLFDSLHPVTRVSAATARTAGARSCVLVLFMSLLTLLVVDHSVWAVLPVRER